MEETLAGVVVSPPSPKLELGPPPAPTVPASRSDFKTFPPEAARPAAGDASGAVLVAALGAQSELSLLLLLPEPISMGRSSWEWLEGLAAPEVSPQTFRGVPSGIIQIEPSEEVADSDGAFVPEFSQMLGEKPWGDWD